MLYIAAAYEGYKETMQQIFGAPEEKPEEAEGAGAISSNVTKGADGKPIVLTPEIFDLQFDSKMPTEIRRKPVGPNV